jgi:hypothetical protein
MKIKNFARKPNSVLRSPTRRTPHNSKISSSEKANTIIMASTSETTITRMINHVLDTSEKIVNVVEEGISILMKGEASSVNGKTSTERSIPDDFGDEEMRMRSSPLEGVADSVLSNIMKGQVRGLGDDSVLLRIF